MKRDTIIRNKTHENGFRSVYQHISSTEPKISIYLYCNVGSAMEPPSLRGVAHFIEHMCFKGTPTHPNPRDFLHIFDSTGAYFNAFTTQRYTVYVVQCHSHDLAQILYTLSDGVLNSSFSPTEYKKEIKVVVEESIRLLDDNDDQSDIIINKMLYAGTPFEYPVDWYEYHTSPESEIMNRQKVLAFYKKWYHPQNMVLSVSGNLSYKQFEHALRGTFFMRKQTTCGVRAELYGLYTPPRSGGAAQYKITPIKVPKTSYVSIGFRTCTYNSPDKYVLDFLAELLSGFFSSKLYSTLRDDNGLTYFSKTFTENYECGGEFVLYAISDVDKLLHNGTNKKPGVIPIIISVLREIKANGPTAAEMRLTKMHIQRSRELVKLSDECAIYNGEYLTMHPEEDAVVVPYQDVYAKYFADITSTQVRDIARKYFIQENMCVCVLGKGVIQQDIERICCKI